METVSQPLEKDPSSPQRNHLQVAIQPPLLCSASVFTCYLLSDLGQELKLMTCEVEQHPEGLVQAGPHPALLLASSSCPGKRWIKSRRVGHSMVSFLSKLPEAF